MTAMRERLEARLNELKDQFARGTERIDQLDAEAAKLRETLLRISGAIQVLSEELEHATPLPEATPS